MSSRSPAFWALAIGIAIGIATASACSAPEKVASDASATGSLSVASALGASDSADLEGFERALEVRPLVFPQDHGPHPGFKTEWWYWIGNLRSEDGRRYGYQLTFFRSALEPPAPAETAATSQWATRQMYMAHLTVTDADGAVFRSFERFSRGAAGLSGVRSDPFRVWLDNWSVEATEPATTWLLRAAEGSVELELSLDLGKPRVLHGDRGLSRKGEAAGAASYYYSRTRMPTRGRLSLGDEVLEVEGSSWFDREWSTSLLGENEVGWDWLGAQLDDGRDLMFFRLRRRDGTSAWVEGSLIDADGKSRPLATEGAQFLPLDTWTSSETGITYPSRIRLTLPAEDLAFEIVPLLEDQELRLSFVYWEGAVVLRTADADADADAGSGANSDREAVTGRGYLEMTGYGERPSPR